jgi:hypothetical protein
MAPVVLPAGPAAMAHAVSPGLPARITSAFRFAIRERFPAPEHAAQAAGIAGYAPMARGFAPLVPASTRRRAWRRGGGRS